MAARSEGHKWTVAQEDTFIEFLKHHPSIWDAAHRDYSNRDRRAVLINEVVALLDHKFTPAEISYKYQNWRSQMRREIARLTRFAPIDTIMSGSVVGPTSKWRMYAKLAFLRDSIVAGSTKLSERGSPLNNTQQRRSGTPSGVVGGSASSIKVEDTLLVDSPPVSPSGQEFAIETDEYRSDCSTDGLSNDSARPLMIDDHQSIGRQSDFITVTSVTSSSPNVEVRATERNSHIDASPHGRAVMKMGGDLLMQPHSASWSTIRTSSPPQPLQYENPMVVSCHQHAEQRKRKHEEMKASSLSSPSCFMGDVGGKKCDVFGKFVADSLRQITSDSVQDDVMLEIHRLLVKAKRTDRAGLADAGSAAPTSSSTSSPHQYERSSIVVSSKSKRASADHLLQNKVSRLEHGSSSPDSDVTTTLPRQPRCTDEQRQRVSSGFNSVSERSAFRRSDQRSTNVVIPTTIATIASLVMPGACALPVQSPLVSPGQHLQTEQQHSSVFRETSAQQVRTIMNAFAHAASSSSSRVADVSAQAREYGHS